MKEMAMQHSSFLGDIEEAETRKASIESSIIPSQRELDRIESGMRHAEAQHGLAVDQKAVVLRDIQREKDHLKQLDNEVAAKHEEMNKAATRNRQEKQTTAAKAAGKPGKGGGGGGEFVSDYQRELASLKTELASTQDQKITLQVTPTPTAL